MNNACLTPSRNGNHVYASSGSNSGRAAVFAAGTVGGQSGGSGGVLAGAVDRMADFCLQCGGGSFSALGESSGEFQHPSAPASRWGTDSAWSVPLGAPSHVQCCPVVCHGLCAGRSLADNVAVPGGSVAGSAWQSLDGRASHGEPARGVCTVRPFYQASDSLGALKIRYFRAGAGDRGVLFPRFSGIFGNKSRSFRRSDMNLRLRRFPKHRYIKWVWRDEMDLG